MSPFWPMSSRRPRRGLIKEAPALAARIACAAEKHKVTLTLIPSFANRRVALSPSRVSGHLTTTLGAILEYSRPSRSMPSVSWLVTSAETGPWTISQMAAICCLKSTPPSLAISEGLVVTPSAIPNEAPSRISFRFAVSRKNFIITSCLHVAASCRLGHGTTLRLVCIINLVPQDADAFHLNFDNIPVLHPRNPCGGSCRNEVPRVKRHNRCYIPY